MRTKSLMCAAVLLMATSSPLLSAVIFIDFGTAQTPASPTGSNYWNTPNSSTITDFQLRESTSSLFDSGVFLTTAGFTAFSSGGTGSPQPSLGDLAVSQATVDFMYEEIGQTATITLSGLDNALTYNFNFFASRDNAENRSTTYAIGASSVVLQTSGTGLGGAGINMNNSTFVTLPNIAPTLGSVSISVSGVSSFGYINAMQITSVPEPSAALLAGLGALALGTIRRSRR